MDIINQFKDYLVGKKISNPTTLKNYLSDIRHFISWYETSFGAVFSENEFDEKIVKLYEGAGGAIILPGGGIDATSKMSHSSLKRRLSSLRQFSKYLVETGSINDNPFTTIASENPKVQNVDKWHIQEFKDYLKFKKASDLTVKNYITDIHSFRRWHEQAIEPHMGDTSFPVINDQIVDEYKKRLVEHKASAPRTINRKLSSLRKFVEFSVASNYASKDFFYPQNEVANVEIGKNESDTKGAISLNDIESQKIKLNYSPIPPIRLFQKLIILPYLLLESAIAGKVITMLYGNAALALAAKKALPALSKLNMPQGPSGLLKVKGYEKEFFAPNEVSLDTYPLQKKLWHHIRHTRPQWYKKYHTLPLVHYIHFAVLIIFAAGAGLALYRNLVTDVKSPLFAAPASPPRILSFQGRLTDNLNNPITSDTSIRFSIYDDLSASGSALLWQEVHYGTIPDQDGIFSVLLGSLNNIPDSVFLENNDIYLGVTVEQTEELTPRRRIASVPYAANSEALQGMLPITDGGAGQTNVVLALDSSGDLTIGGSAAPTFSATGGQFTLSGEVLLLTTETGTDSNVIIAPDGLGGIDLQKPLFNTSTNGNLTPGGVEINDKFGVLATESAVAAFTLNNDGVSDLFTASSSGTTRFTIGNDGTLTIPVYNTPGGLLYANGAGVVGQTTTGSGSECLLGGATPTWGSCGTGTSPSPFQELNGAIVPLNTTLDFLIGGQSTDSAKFAFLNSNSGTPTASISANSGNNATYLTGDGTLATTNRGSLILGNSSTYNTTGNVLINPNGAGRVGIGTTTPDGAVHIVGDKLILEEQNVGDGFTIQLGRASDGSLRNWLRAEPVAPTNTTFDFHFGGNTSVFRDIYFKTNNVENGIVLKNTTGYVGINNANPDRNLDILDDTDPQLRLTQTDGSVYTDFQTDSSGNLVISPTGTTLTLSGVTTLTASSLSTITSASTLGISATTLNLGAGGAATIGTVSDDDLSLSPHGTGDIRLVNDGDTDIIFPGFTSDGGLLYTNGSGALAQTAIGAAGECLTSAGGGSPTWGLCGASAPFQELNGAIVQNNTTLDFLIGGQSTDSAKFAVLNMNTGTPVASVSSTLTGNGVSIGGDGRIQSFNRNNLIIGGFTTGNIILSPANGGGRVGINTGASLPRATLEVGGVGNLAIFGNDTLTDEYIAVRSTSSGVMFGIDPDLNGGSGAGLIQSGNSKGLAFETNNGTWGSATTPDMYIDTAGNVGIGTNTPMGKLDVVGNATVSGDLTFYGGTGRIQTVQNNNLILGGTSTGSILLSPLNGAGRVGINTALPTEALDVNGNILLAGGGTFDTRTANTLGIGTTNATTITLGRTGQGITLPGFTTDGGIFYANGTGQLAQTTAGSLGECLQSAGGGSPTWGTCGAGGVFQELNGAIVPNNSTTDFLIGGQSTDSAKFAILNVNDDAPVASLSASTGEGLSLSHDGTIQTTLNRDLVLGGDTTGNIALMPINGNGYVGIGTTSPTRALEIRQTTVGGTTELFLYNPDGTSGASNSRLRVTTNGASAGDPFAVFDVNGVGGWAVGLDNSDDDKFKIGTNINSLGTNNLLTLDTAGNLGLGTTTPQAPLHIQSGASSIYLSNVGESISSQYFLAPGDDNYLTGAKTGDSGIKTHSSLGGFVLGRNNGNVEFKMTNGGLFGIGTYYSPNGVDPTAKFQVYSNLGTEPAASISAVTSAPALLVTNDGVGDLFAASSSGTPNFIINNNGDIIVGPEGTGKITAAVIDPYLIQNQYTSGNTQLTFQTMAGSNGDFIFQNQSDNLATLFQEGLLHLEVNGSSGGLQIGDDTQLYRGGTNRLDLGSGDSFNVVSGDYQLGGSTIIDSSGNATFNDITITGTCAGCVSSGNISPFQQLAGSIVPTNATLDFLIGGQATDSAKFAILNMSSGTPTASISANSGNNTTYLTGTGNLGTTNKQTLSLGGSSTGLIKVLNSSGNPFATFDTVNGRLGIGTQNPQVAFEIADGAAAGSFRIGADVNANTLTSNTRKIGRIVAPSYSGDGTGTNVFLIGMDANTTSSTVTIGGGASFSPYAATAIQFYTGATTTTTGGTHAMTINSTQNVGIGLVPGSTNKLQVRAADNQLRLDVDASNGLTINADSSGFNTFTANGAGAGFNFTGGNLGIGDTSPASLFTVGNGDLFQVNSSGAIAAATGITSSGTITFSSLNTDGGLLYTNGSGVLSQTGAGTGTQCLLGGTTPTFGSCATGTTPSPFTQLDGAIVPNNSTLDFLVGSQATDSAKFAVLNVNGTGPAIASVSGNLIVMPHNGAGGRVGIGTTTPSSLLAFAEGTTQEGGINFGSDASLFRSGTSTLSSLNNLFIGSTTPTLSNGSTDSVETYLVDDSSEDFFGLISRVGSDGLFRVIYLDDEFEQSLEFAQCTDVNCTSPNINTVYTVANYTADDINFTLASDDTARIVYTEPNVLGGELIFEQCTNASCSSTNTTTLDSDNGSYVQSIVMGNDNLSRIVYQDAGDGNLKFIQCTNASCSTNNQTALYSNGEIGPDIVIGGDGFARMAIYNGADGDMEFVQCTNASCSTRNTTAITSANFDWPEYLALGGDGFGRLIYTDDDTGDLNYVQCTNASCSTRNTTAIDSGDYSDFNVATLDSNDYARIVFEDDGTSELKYVECTNASCSTNNSVVFADNDTSSYWAYGISLDSSGNPHVVYLNEDSGIYFLYKCADSSCSSSTKKSIALGDYPEENSIPVAINNASTSFMYMDNNNNHIYSAVITAEEFEPDGDDLYVAGDIAAGGNIYTDGALVVGGSADFGGIVNINGEININGSAIFNNGITAYGTSTFDNVDINNSLDVNGSISANSISTSNLTLNGNLTQSGGLYTTLGVPFSAGASNDIYVSGRYAYLANGTGGLRIIDVYRPSSSSITGTYNTSGTAYDVFVSGKYAYVADGTSGLQIVDVSNPSSPTLAGTVDTSGTAYGIYVSGKYAYVADDTAGLHVIDISDPASPVIAGTYNTSGNARSVFITGKYAYVADSASGLQIVDVSNPSTPTLTGTYNSPNSAVDVYVSGRYAYIADTSAFIIVDISNPASPSQTGLTSTSSIKVAGSGIYSYALDSFNYLRTMNVSNPSSPSTAQFGFVASSPTGVAIAGKYAYFSVNDSTGFRISEFYGMSTPNLYAGSIQTNDLNVTENGIIGNDLYVRSGLMVGDGGIQSQGGLGIFSGYATNIIEGAATGKALLTLNETGNQDIFTASSSGTPRFSITNAGGIKLGTAEGTLGECIKSGGAGAAASWGSCGGAGGAFQELAGAIVPNNSTLDFLIGGQATSSAKFAITGINGTGPATASVSGNLTVMPHNGAGGNVGIGTTAPANRLSVIGNANIGGHVALGTGATINGLTTGIDTLTGATARNSVLATYETIDPNNSDANYAGSSTGLILDPQSAPEYIQAYGSESFLEVASGNSEDFSGLLSGIGGGIIHSGTGTLSSAAGLSYGVLNLSTGTITSATGINLSTINLNASGEIGTLKGINIQTPINSGTITDAYGLFIDDQTAATNDYGIAIVGADTQALWIGSGADNTDAANGIAFGSSRDTNLYRSAANTLATDDALQVGTKLTLSGTLTSFDNTAEVIQSLGTGDMTVAARGDLRFNIDSNANGSNLFRILAHTSNQLLTLDESGNLSLLAGGSLDTLSGGTLGIGNTTATTITLGRTGQGITLPGFDCSALSSGGKLTTTSGGVLTCANDSGGSTTVFQELAGAIVPNNSTLDFLIGGQATSSAKFSITDIAKDSNTQLNLAGTATVRDLVAQDITLSGLSTSIITGYEGFDGYTNFSGGIGTGNLLASAQRITSTGNLTNIGSIQAGETHLTNGGTFVTKVDYTTGTDPWHVSVGDVNGDGKLDLATANQTGDSVSVFINNGDGTFATKVDYTAGNATQYVEIGDLNGDGKADMASTNWSSATVSVFINNGDGTFATKVDYTTGGQPQGVDIGDLNGDGKADLAVSSASSTSVSVFINKGNGTFLPKVDYTTGSAPHYVAIGDVNGDGKQDLAVANLTGHSVSIFINNGDGTFATKVDYTTDLNPHTVILGDVNGDGKADIATANSSPSADSVSVLINDGDGTFATKVDYPLGELSYSVAMGDLNGDGKPDLAATRSNTNVSVLINDGDGTFANAVNYTVQNTPRGVIIGDLNSDGKGDLAVANYNSNSISVLLNNTNTIFYAQASTGNVGIGTAAPDSKLDLRGGNLRVRDNVSGAHYFQIANTDATGTVLTDNYGYIGLGTSTVGGGTPVERMRLSANGTVGIGTSSPIAQLHVTRPIGTEFVATGKALAIFDQIEDQDILTASSGGTTKFVINNDGYVGIGVSSPITPIQVMDNAASIYLSNVGQSISSHWFLAPGNDNFLTGVLTGDSGFSLHNSLSGFAIGNNATGVQFRIGNTGNTGIGTYNSPTGVSATAKLQVYSNLGTTPAASISAKSTTAPTLLVTKDGGANDLIAASSSGSIVFKLGSTGGITIYDDLLPATDDSIELGSTDFAFNTVWTNSVAAGGSDLAEYYKKANPSEQFEAGQLVCLSSNGGVTKCTQGVTGSILGVISDNAAFIGGSKHTDDDNYVLVGLVGQLDVKVQGDIKAGDALTVSSTTGVATKATKESYIIGRALQNNQNGQLQRVATSIQAGYFNPNLALNAAGDDTATFIANLNINEENGIFSITDAGGNLIDRTSAFSNLVAANIKAGFINVQKLSADTISATTGTFANLTSGVANITSATVGSLSVGSENVLIAGTSLRDYVAGIVEEIIADNVFTTGNEIISPVASIDRINTNIISPLGDEASIEIEVKPESIAINNTDTGEKAVEIDNAGNATFSGQLASDTLTTNDATISGTLSADRIIANTIDGLDDRISSIAGSIAANNQSTPSGNIAYADEIETGNIYADFGIYSQGLTVLGSTTTSQLTAMDSIAIGTGFIMTDNSINTLGATLQIQPLRQGNIDFMAGRVTIDTDGNVDIAGNLNLAGIINAPTGVFDNLRTNNLATNIISPLGGSDLTIKLGGDNEASGSSNLRVTGSNGNEVLKISGEGNIAASGSATFDKLNFNLVGEALADSDTTAIATGSAGFATLNRNKPEITIYNDKVTANSLIYITPFGDTQNKVIHLLRQIPHTETLDGSFTIGVSGTPATRDIQFNWLIVN